MTAHLPEHVIVDVTDLQVRFAGSHERAVTDVDLQIKHGEVTALVGESGSGKSVSSRAIMGLLPSSATVSGSAILSGRGDAPNVQLLGAGRRILNTIRGARVAMVFQEPTTALNPLMTIGAQIDEIMLVHEDISRAEAKQRSLELLSEATLQDPERIYRSYPHQVSGGQLQRACIAMAIACRPCVLIADEPTTALDMTAQAAILELLRSLAKQRHLGILLITHDMGVVADLADSVIVLRQGQVEESGPVDQVFYHPQADYTKRLLASVPRLGHVLEAQPSGVRGVSDEDASAAVQALLQRVRDSREDSLDMPAVRVQDVDVVYGSGRKATRAVNHVSFDIAQGEIVALVGESGSGKSTISATLYGQLRPTSGRVLIDGHDVSALRGRARRQVLSHIGVIFQNPASSLNPRRTVIESVAEPLRTHTSLSSTQRRERALQALTAARLEPAYADRYPHELSGGQRQRVAIARAIVMRPSLVVADEPTSALDVSVQAQVLATLRHLQKEMGFAVLLITHDLAVVEQLAARTVVLRNGSVVEAGATSAILTAPETDYTRRLLDAVPVADPHEQAERRKRTQAHDLTA